MSAISHEKLERIIQRFATVEHELSSGGSGGDAFVKLSREYADLEPTAGKALELRKAYGERRDLEDMLKAGGELAEMAQAERPVLEESIERMEQEWDSIERLTR
jgi:peptide chain release factor 1